MGAGVMQLAFFGQQDTYIYSNPNITFFKKVYQTHTNFAMEPISVNLNNTNTNIYEKTILKVKIPRHADLLSQIYFVFDLPEILSNNLYRFRWVDNIGETFIDNYSVSIGGSIIDKQYGEYLHIMNCLTFTENKRNCFDKMSGNILKNTNPAAYTLNQINISDPPVRYRIGANYPVGIDYNPLDPASYKPSISTMKIHIPLLFWFNKSIEDSLPLIALQYSEVELTIELRPWVELYRLYYSIDGKDDYYAPNKFLDEHQLKHFVSNVRTAHLINDSVIDAKCYIDCNYIYLDKVERDYFAQKSLDYIIEQVIQVNHYNIKDNAIIDLVLQNPIKELYWCLKRSDVSKYNTFFEYQDTKFDIMESAKIIFNGTDRIEMKPGSYFNYVQAFQHHSGNNKDGLYVYSFSIYPENLRQPSGSCNFSRINNVQLQMNLKPTIGNSYAYDLVVYSTNYNFLRISSGLAGLAFSI
jgi:Large eukaryotic DNA virus major capsid protein/Major capsid protein N-terminus